MLRSFICSIVILFTSLIGVNVSAKISSSEIYDPGAYDFVYGKPDAPVKVLEYFSLTCPHCENFHTTVFPKLKSNYIDTGKVMWIKRSYTIDEASNAGTMLLNCVDKKSYEAFLNILLTKQSSWAYQKDFLDKLRNIAGLGGISTEKFDNCMKDKKLARALIKIAQDGKRILKFSGTPSFYINQKKTEAYSYKSFTKQIDKALSELEKK